MSRGCTVTGAAETMHGFDGNANRDDDQGERIDECGEHAGALVAEGFLVRCGTALEVHGDEGEQQSQGVRDVVAGFRDQRERMSMQTGEEGDQHVDERGRQRQAQDALRTRGLGAVNVHTHSVCGALGKAQRCALDNSSLRRLGRTAL